MSRKILDTTLRMRPGGAIRLPRDAETRLSPDTTGKLSRDSTGRMARPLAQAAAGAARSLRFAWPAPPHFEFSDEASAQAAGECLLTFRDGAEASGALLDFLPDDALLKFQQTDTAAGISIVFSGLRGLQLRQPVAVQRQAISLGHAEHAAEPERQPFSINLVDGQAFHGETVGHINALCGVFLFLPEKDGRVIRSFVPTEAIQDCNFGPLRLGRLHDRHMKIEDAYGRLARHGAWALARESPAPLRYAGDSP